MDEYQQQQFISIPPFSPIEVQPSSKCAIFDHYTLIPIMDFGNNSPYGGNILVGFAYSLGIFLNPYIQWDIDDNNRICALSLIKILEPNQPHKLKQLYSDNYVIFCTRVSIKMIDLRLASISTPFDPDMKLRMDIIEHSLHQEDTHDISIIQYLNGCEENKTYTSKLGIIPTKMKYPVWIIKEGDQYDIYLIPSFNGILHIIECDIIKYTPTPSLDEMIRILDQYKVMPIFRIIPIYYSDLIFM